MPPYHQQESNKYEEAFKASSQTLPTYYKLVVHPMGKMDTLWFCHRMMSSAV
jgi:hypothetical protein